MKKILITGASSGIGREICIQLSNVGFQCVLIGRNLKELENTLSLMAGSCHLSFCGDLNDNEFLSYIVEKVDFISGLIHSAGIIKLMPINFIKRDNFDEIMNINFFAPFFLTQAFLKKRKIYDESSIVFISSISGQVIGSKGNLMYSSSKSALNGMVKVLALELADKKIRVNAITAGMVTTEMWDNNSVTSEQLLLDSKKYPLGYGKPSDIASLASFLISNESKWITGSTIVIDGGFTIQ